MTFGKSLYLLEALFSANRETVCYSHITGEVTTLPISLNRRNFVPVTVSNLVKLYPANCFVLRLHAVFKVLLCISWAIRFSEIV